jgi:protein-disulfide isomerase
MRAPGTAARHDCVLTPVQTLCKPGDMRAFYKHYVAHSISLYARVSPVCFDRLPVLILTALLFCQPAYAALPSLPGVDTKDLDSEEKELLLGILEAQFDPCGKPVNLLASVQSEKCAVATRLANFAVGQIQRGLSKKQVIRALLKEQKRLTTRHKFDVTGRPFLGPEKAKVTLVEFFDFECPHCRIVAGKMESLLAKYSDVKLVYKQYPLSFHPNARIAAIQGIAGHMQGKWKLLHDLFFENQSSLSEAKIAEIVAKVKLDTSKLKKDLAAAERLVIEDRREGDAAEIDGTPTFFVNGRMVEFEEIEAAIKSELGKK